MEKWGNMKKEQTRKQIQEWTDKFRKHWKEGISFNTLWDMIDLNSDEMASLLNQPNVIMPKFCLQHT